MLSCHKVIEVYHKLQKICVLGMIFSDYIVWKDIERVRPIYVCKYVGTYYVE